MTSNAPISLDYTLRDLYALDNEGKSCLTLIYHHLPVEAHQNSSLAKYIYHSSLQAKETSADACIELELKTLPQRYGFSAGRLPLIMPKFDSGSHEGGHERDHEEVSTDYTDVCRNFSQLRCDQQPIVSFPTNPILLGPGAVIAVAEPSDCLSHLPHLIDPEMHYEILSKRGLALSGLPTPPSAVIDPVFFQPDHGGHDPARLEQEIFRMTQPFDTRRVPFMVKLSQSFSGRGVFVVYCDGDKARVKAIICAQLRGTLAKINFANNHLYPCSLVFQDYVVGTTVALSLFVTQKGRPVFIGCCTQRFDKQGYWAGGSISYADQAALHKMYAKTVEKTAQFLHYKGYHGPAGVDIITNGSGEQYIVDLNARVTGSYHLGPLAGHFVSRGLGMAAVVAEYFPCSRAAFEKAFFLEAEQGILIITGWLYDESMQLSYGAITVAGRNWSEMEKSLEKIRAHAVPLSKPEALCYDALA